MGLGDSKYESYKASDGTIKRRLKAGTSATTTSSSNTNTKKYNLVKPKATVQPPVQKNTIQPPVQKNKIQPPVSSSTSSNRRNIELNDKNKNTLKAAYEKYGKEAMEKKLKDAGVTYKDGKLTAPGQQQKQEKQQVQNPNVKILDNAGKENLDNQLKQYGYDDSKIADYYKQNNIQFGGQQQQKDFKPVQSHQEWIERGKKPTELVDLVESRYGINAEYDPKTNKVMGYDADGNLTKSWSFDSAGNSIREEHAVYTSDQFLGDFNSVLATGDKAQINAFLNKHKDLYKENKDALIAAVKGFQKEDKINKVVSKVATLDGKGLYNATLDGTFAKGDDVFNKLTPEQQLELDTFTKRYVRQDAKDPTKKIIADLNSDDAEEIYNKMAIHNPTYQDKYKEIVFENQDRKDLQGGLVSKYEGIEKKRLTLQRLKEKIDLEHPSASETYKRALLNRESRALLDEIEDMTVDYNVNLAEFNMIDADAQAEYQAYQMDAEIEYTTYQNAVGIAVQRYNVERENMNQKEMLQIQYDQQNLTRQKNEEFQMTIKRFDAQISAGIEERSAQRNLDAEKRAETRGIEAESRAEERSNKKGVYQTNDKGELLYVVNGSAQKVLESNGTVVATEKTDEYQESLQKNTYGGYDIIRTYQDGRRPTINSYDMNGKLIGGMPSTVSNAISKIGEIDRQCGEGANDYLQNLGLSRLMGNSYESKKEDINSQEPVVGSLAIWNPNQGQGKYKEYGHVGIVTGINDDGTVEITDWNYKGDEKKMTHNVQKSVIAYNGGYHVPKLGDGEKRVDPKKAEAEAKAKQEKLSKIEAEKNVDVWVEAYKNGTRNLTSILEKDLGTKERAAMKDMFMTKIQDIGLSDSHPKVQEMSELRDILKNLSENQTQIDNTSGMVQWASTNFFDQEKSQFLGDIQYFLDSDTLDELINVKAQGATFGSLTEKELTMLQKSANRLSSYAERDDTGKITGFNLSPTRLKELLGELHINAYNSVNGLTKNDTEVELIESLKGFELD